MTAKVERDANNLRSILNDLSRMEIRRKRKIEALRAKAKSDDVHHDLLQEAARLEREYPMQTIEAVQFEDFFDKRLRMYSADQKDVQSEEADQDELLSRLQNANEALNTARKGDSSTKEREQALQKLENAYLTYKEIIGNLDTGRKFYNDLAAIATRFRDECRTFVYQRRAEASQLEGDISTSMAQMSLKSANSVNLRHQKQQETMQGRSDPRNGGGTPLVAPTPTRSNMGPPPPIAAATAAADTHAHAGGVWTPEMGIKFGGQGAPNANGSR